MNQFQYTLLISIADHAEVMHQALEGKDIDFDDRIRYTGHLAMCARLFKTIMLGEPIHFLQEYIKTENKAFMFTPKGERGEIAKESWSILLPALEQYIDARQSI